MARTPEQIREANRIACAKWRKKHRKEHNLNSKRVQNYYISKGLCSQCGKPRNKSIRYCDYHLKVFKGRQRLRRYIKRNDPRM